MIASTHHHLPMETLNTRRPGPPPELVTLFVGIIIICLACSEATWVNKIQHRFISRQGHARTYYWLQQCKHAMPCHAILPRVCPLASYNSHSELCSFAVRSAVQSVSDRLTEHACNTAAMAAGTHSPQRPEKQPGKKPAAPCTYGKVKGAYIAIL